MIDLVIDASGSVDYTWVAIKSVAANGEINKNKEPSATFGNWWKAYWPLLNVSAFRGFALLEGQDPTNFTIPFPAIGDPRVTNMDLSIALFDKLALARYFESDGTTPKRETVTTLDKPTSGQRIPLIFTDKKLKLSRMPKNLLHTTLWKQEKGELDNNTFTTPGKSMHLKELSVLSERDSAGSYKSWFDFEIQPETDFIKGNQFVDKGIYVGPQYAFTPDEEDPTTKFLHRGFKSKNIKNITLELSEDYKTDSFSNYWYKPKAPLFEGITDLKIPEFAYLKVEFNEPLDPTKYWLNVDYNQTAGGNEEHKTVKITDSDQNNINSNIKDYVMEESNPEPNCFITEKNEEYARIFVGPFFSRPIAYRDSNTAGMVKATDNSDYSRRFRITATYYFTSGIGGKGLYLGSASQDRYPTGNVIDTIDQISKNALYEGESIITKTFDLFGDENSAPRVRTQPTGGIFLLPGGASDLQIRVQLNLSWFKKTVLANGASIEEPQPMNLWTDKDGDMPLTLAGDGWDNYPSMDDVNIQDWEYGHFAPNLYENIFGNYYSFSASSMLRGGTTKWASGGDTASKDYTYHSSPELENYAWKVSQGKEKMDEFHKVIHNIRIQGGIMISDEYSAPVLP